MEISARRNKPPEPPPDTYDLTLTGLSKRDAGELMTLIGKLPVIPESWHYRLYAVLQKHMTEPYIGLTGRILLADSVNEGTVHQLRFTKNAR